MVVIFTPSRSVAPRKQVHIPPLEKKQSPYKLLWKVQGVICHGWVSPSKHWTVKIVNSHHPAFKLAFHRFLIARPRHAHSFSKNPGQTAPPVAPYYGSSATWAEPSTKSDNNISCSWNFMSDGPIRRWSIFVGRKGENVRGKSWWAALFSF